MTVVVVRCSWNLVYTRCCYCYKVQCQDVTGILYLQVCSDRHVLWQDIAGILYLWGSVTVIMCSGEMLHYL